MTQLFPTFSSVWRRLKAGPSWRLGTIREVARRAESISLLRLLAVATKQQVELAPLVDAFADDHAGSQRVRLKRLAKQLEQGASLPDSLEQTPGVLWDESLLAIRFGREMGAMNQAIEDELNQQVAIADRLPAWHPRVWIYWIILLVYGLGVGAFLSIKIMPTFQTIVADFDIPYPAPLQLYDAFTQFVVAWWWLGVSVILGLVWFVVTGRLRRSCQRGWLSRLLPGRVNCRSADVLQNLGTAAAAGRPLTNAISTLARYHFDPAVRRQLLYVRNEVEQGADQWECMQQTDLLSKSDRTLCEAGSRAGNLAWVLKRLGFQRRWQSSTWTRTASDLVHPFVMVGFGLYCLLVACAVFSSVTHIILHLAKGP